MEYNLNPCLKLSQTLLFLFPLIIFRCLFILRRIATIHFSKLSTRWLCFLNDYDLNVYMNLTTCFLHFVSCEQLAADPDINVKNGSELLDRLLKVMNCHAFISNVSYSLETHGNISFDVVCGTLEEIHSIHWRFRWACLPSDVVESWKH